MNRKRLFFWLLNAFCLFFCLNNLYATQDTFSRIVTTHWLEKHIKDETVRVLDVRTSAEYQSGHLNHAVNIPVNETFGSKPRDDLLAPLSKIRKLFGQAGIDLLTHVVVYDNGSLIDAARMIWILESNGNKKVSLLDGGFPAWKTAKLKTTKQPVTVKSRIFIPKVEPELIATKFSTRLAIDNPELVLIDARTADEFNGKTSMIERKGHIPSAVNIPWEQNFKVVNGNTQLKSSSELRKVYADIDKNKKIITYCNKGKQSALTLFVLKELGYSVSAYDGSWYEWGNDLSLPIEKSKP